MSKKISLILCLLLALTMVLSACSNETPKQYIDNGSSNKQEISFVANQYFVEKGKSDYIIVMENNPDDYISTAASELQTFFAEATGFTLSILEDKETTGKEKHIFSLGSTSYARLAMGTTGSELGESDYRIASKNGNVYILSGGSTGVCWGVYKLLYYMFDYEFYKEGIYTLNHDVTTLNYFETDVTKKAFIAYRSDYTGMNLYGSTISSTRLGLTRDDDLVVGDRHNSLDLLDSSTYSDHPDWYSTDQLCYTAHGNEEEWNAMVDTASDLFVNMLLEEGALNKTYARFQVMDTQTSCTCASCTAATEKYGSVSGAILVTCNAIGEATTRKLNERDDDRKIKIVPLLYHASEDVPVTKNADGSYVLNSEIGSLDYVTPMWACLSRKNHSKSWFDDENKSALDMLNQMEAAFEEYWIWDYGVDFNDYLIPFDTFNNMGQDFYRLKDYHIGLYLYQLAHSAHNVTGFNSLKVYLMSKLMFDPTLDQEELTNKYFAHVYGEGGAKMKEVYEGYRILTTYNSTERENFEVWYQSVYAYTMNIVKEEYWPMGTLKNWLDLIDEAYEAIGCDGAWSSTDTAQANSASMYERNILTDSVFVRYIYAYLYLQENYDSNVAFKLKLYHDVENLGFYQVKEDSSGSGLWPLRESLNIGNYL